MKKRKPRIIQDKKQRGEWAESVFMARAGEHGLPVSKPWGDSESYDCVVGSPGRFVAVQVKCTISKLRSGKGYVCSVCSSHKSYRAGSFDFLAAYVVVEDAWYIIPAKEIRGLKSISLFTQGNEAKYEEYREAWQLLREASEGSSEAAGGGEAVEGESCAEDSAGAEAGGEQSPPASAAGRMEAAMNYFKQRLEGGGVDLRKR
jgi:hypothetical protein